MRMRLCLAVLALLTSCSTPVHNAVYTPPESLGGLQCIGSCSSARDYCQQGCGFEESACVKPLQEKAFRDYELYTQTQHANHYPIVLNARNFEHTEPCEAEKNSCMNDCETRYQSCYESCGGNVTSADPCSFLCF